MDYVLFYSEIAYTSERNEGLSCSLYPLVILLGVVDINIVDYMDRLHSLKWLCSQKFNILILFGVADQYITNAAGITLPFLFRYETPSIIKMCHSINCKMYQIHPWYHMSNMASFQPFITYWQVGRDLKNVPSNMK